MMIFFSKYDNCVKYTFNERYTRMYCLRLIIIEYSKIAKFFIYMFEAETLDL